MGEAGREDETVSAQKNTRAHAGKRTRKHTRPHSIPVNAEVVAYYCGSRRVAAARRAAFPEWRSKIRTEDDAKREGMQVIKSNATNQFDFAHPPASGARNVFPQKDA